MSNLYWMNAIYQPFDRHWFDFSNMHPFESTLRIAQHSVQSHGLIPWTPTTLPFWNIARLTRLLISPFPLWSHCMSDESMKLEGWRRLFLAFASVAPITASGYNHRRHCFRLCWSLVALVCACYCCCDCRWSCVWLWSRSIISGRCKLIRSRRARARAIPLIVNGHGLRQHTPSGPSVSAQNRPAIWKWPQH